MAEDRAADDTTGRRTGPVDRLARIGSDWWATILGLVITALAVAGLLPRIGW